MKESILYAIEETVNLLITLLSLFWAVPLLALAVKNSAWLLCAILLIAGVLVFITMEHYLKKNGGRIFKIKK